MLLWSKLVFLAPMALTTSAAGAPFGDVIADPTARARLEACVAEACAVAVASGATAIEAGKTLSVLLRMPAAQRSSMQKDLEARLPPELDAIAGPILRGAERHGIDAPATRGLVAL